MDITPVISEGKKIIKSYDDDSFKINDDIYKSSIIILPDKVIDWNVEKFELLTQDDFDIIKDDDIEILLLGTGKIHKALPKLLKYNFNFAIEPMTNGAASRTYNILLAEGRKVAVALII